MPLGMRSKLIILCVATLRFASVYCVEVMGEEGHPVDHKHDFDHLDPEHGHDRDHEGHNDPHGHRNETLAQHEIEHHEDFTITELAYDVRDRPGAANRKPCYVRMEIVSHFVQTVDEEKQEVVAAMMLTMTWTDNRVRAFEEMVTLVRTAQSYENGIPFPGEMKHKLWMPDLYLPMARRVTVPFIMDPAESITLQKKRTLKYQAYFIIAFKCKMNYMNYPMDEQICFLDFMSYSLSMRNLMLNWGKKPLTGKTKTSTRHFHITISRPEEHTLQNDDQHQVLRIKFHLRRHIEFHVLRTYVPTALLVVVGWLSVLVPLDFAYGRMVLSITTLLVLVSIFVSVSQFSPGVNEVKALDVWILMCICFVFTAIVSCIVDLRLLSIVEKESQIAAEDQATRVQFARQLKNSVPEATRHSLFHPPGQGHARAARMSWLEQLGIPSMAGADRPGPRVLPPLAGGRGAPPAEPPGRRLRPLPGPASQLPALSASVAQAGLLGPPTVTAATRLPPTTAPNTDPDPAELYGGNVPFQPDRQPLMATEVVIWWLRLAVFLERLVLVAYPLLYALLVAVYVGIYFSRRTTEEDVLAGGTY